MPGTLQTDLTRAADLLRAATDVTLLAHVRPDADALGSALALGLVLRRRGARVRVSFADPAEPPEGLRGLDTEGLWVPPATLPAGEGLLVVLDTASPARLGALGGRVPAAVAAGVPVLVVDHHATNTRYGTHDVVDGTAEATAVLVLRLIDELGAELDEPVARCLYAGVMTDTSGFRRARPATHHVAARLLAAGVDPDPLTRALVDDHPFAWLPMLGAVLAGARLDPAAAAGRGLVHAVVPAELVATVRLEEVESVIDVVRSTREAEVAAVLKELEPGEWTVSLRAKEAVDVAAAARALGGGGHRLAAGCTVRGTADEVVARIKAALAGVAG
ncbi:nanoRNase/pAp phosphatase, hydrolyzes c-di-AMP and oligoRNAs [Amycolatopsis arida]|uniref:NanoRNase/pAp phosphatase, hydrolyzes c-di-AMP and oligoRNAs n=1 Tax=Amycolatopsis arida TaxID=587909 RepID=A0A1I5VDL1_9PSEU|nr:DHH family phosphoesterase [Amycolatopsis arida]TDX91241.1 nanoRNase/pAp phosphatase (c-di-AMP/oligoRNAs hydrolase) [Amycolatopsis arida]SFQ05560.1 nanoRNase/pAp phosphatase, hydrolyzes c-di-AMP and oligoRNAs [Amycolatopsis arida]